MEITIEYIYKCRHCGEKFHEIENVEVDASRGTESILSNVRIYLRKVSQIAEHQCLDGRVIGVGDLQGAYPYEKRGG